MPSSAASATSPPTIATLARQTESVAVLDKLRAWLDDTIDKVPPSTPLGKAMGYLHNQWKGLVRFCDDARYGIDTNSIENAIRPFAVGRRNWLFADTVAGAHAKRPALFADRVCQGERARALRLPASRVYRTAQPRNRSPTSKPCCRPVSTPPPWPEIHSKSCSPPHVNNALCGALTRLRPQHRRSIPP